MNDRIILDAAMVARQIANLKAVYPELAEDDELLASAIEGETDLYAIADRIVDLFIDAVTMKEAIAGKQKALNERGARFDRKADAMRELLAKLMVAADQPMIRLPTATLSLRKGPDSLVVDAPDELPQGFFKTERVPLKTEIRDALKAGTDVPGARLVPAEMALAVRTK